MLILQARFLFYRKKTSKIRGNPLLSGDTNGEKYRPSFCFWSYFTVKCSYASLNFYHCLSLVVFIVFQLLCTWTKQTTDILEIVTPLHLYLCKFAFKLGWPDLFAVISVKERVRSFLEDSFKEMTSGSERTVKVA